MTSYKTFQNISKSREHRRGLTWNERNQRTFFRTFPSMETNEIQIRYQKHTHHTRLRRGGGGGGGRRLSRAQHSSSTRPTQCGPGSSHRPCARACTTPQLRLRVPAIHASPHPLPSTRLCCLVRIHALLAHSVLLLRYSSVLVAFC